jgi:esterase/lipase
MTHFKYHKISKSKKIRFIYNINKGAPFVVFLHGFMSDLEGKKPNAFLKFAKKNKLSFLALEYSGHGKSSGKFINGNITKWSNETSALIKKFIKKKNLLLLVQAWVHG